MKKVTAVLLLLLVMSMQIVWASNYCFSCFFSSLESKCVSSSVTPSCCQHRRESKNMSVQESSTNERKCTSCGDNCKCNTLETEQKLDHTLVDFSFNMTVDFVLLFSDVFPFIFPTNSFDIENTFAFSIDISPPPQWGIILFKTDKLLI